MLTDYVYMEQMKNAIGYLANYNLFSTYYHINLYSSSLHQLV